MKTTSPATPRILVAVTIVLTLMLVACDSLSVSPQDDVPSPYTSCPDSNNPLELTEASEQELMLACLVRNHPEQQRPEMRYHPMLGEVARMRAQDMAERGYYGGEDFGLPYPPHVDHDGYGPDYHVCEAGYELRDLCEDVHDEPQMNSIESIGWGAHNPGGMFEWWLGSTGHRAHMLAVEPYHEHFVEQVYYGAGYAYVPDDPDRPGEEGHFWVFLTAPPSDTEASGGE